MLSFINRGKFAVVGFPIVHSKSPLIHQQFANQFLLQLDYTAIAINPEQTTFISKLNNLLKNNFVGFNVTVPYKLDAYDFSEVLSKDANLAHSVNTLGILEQNGKIKIYGDNTDGKGLIKDITKNLNFTIKDKKVLIIGAGGAASGILYPILDMNPRKVTLANKTPSRAVNLVKRIIAGNCNLSNKITGNAIAAQEVQQGKYDLVINATSASLSGFNLELNHSIYKSASLCYDLVYQKGLTDFLKMAKKVNPNIMIADGLGMLVEQAGFSFKLWHNLEPDTYQVIKYLKKQLK